MTAGVGHRRSFGGWSSSLLSKIWRTVMNSGHWVCIITTAWRQRNSKHFLTWWLIIFLQIYFIFARICSRFARKNRLKEGSRLNEGKFVLNIVIDFIVALKPDGLCVYETTKQDGISFQCIFNIDSLFYYIDLFK
jgi:hypothetical protein